MRKFVGKILRNKIMISLIIAKLLLDVLLYVFSNFASVIIRFDFVLNMNYFHVDDWFGIVEICVFIIFALILQLPQQSFEFASIHEVSNIFLVVVSSKILSYLVLYLSRSKVYFSRGAFAISVLISFLLIAGVRIIFRWIYNKRRKEEPHKRFKNAIIIGAGDAGEQLLREILAHSELSYRVIGFLDDDPFKKKVKIHGVSVLGPIERLPYIIKDNGVEVVIYAIPTAPRELLKKVFELVSEFSVEVKTLPAIWEIISGRIRVEDIKNIELEDLLPRASIKMDNAVVEAYLKGKVVLITGAGGSIGSEISRQVVNFMPGKVILLGRGENRIFDIEREIIEKKKYFDSIPVICDIRNREKIFKVFEQYKPDIVFHAAAHKHVPLMEKNPDEAVLNNVFGTKNLLDAALRFKVERFINISTDKAVNPKNIMGASKRVTEMLIQYYSNNGNESKFASVRFGNVLGSTGSVIEVFKKQIKETGVLTITDPQMERYFMLITEAVQLVLQAAALGKNGEIFVLKLGEPVNILDFAKHFIKLSGKELGKDIQIKIVGNRGGEKLKEELWSESETVEKTENPYILKVIERNNSFNKEDFFKKLKELESVSSKFNEGRIKLLLKDIIPELK